MSDCSTSEFTNVEQSIVGVQAGVSYNVSVFLEGVDGFLRKNMAQSIQVHHEILTVNEAKEEEMFEIQIPPLPQGTYALLTVVLDTRRLPADPVALLGKRGFTVTCTPGVHQQRKRPRPDEAEERKAPAVVEQTAQRGGTAPADAKRSCTVDGAHREAASFIDNAQLSEQPRLGILLVGVFMRGVSDALTLPKLVNNVINPLAGAADVFVHTEPYGASAANAAVLAAEAAGIEESCRAHLGDRLKGLLVRQSEVRTVGTMITSQAKQFSRVRDAFEVLLGQEMAQGFRYSHVARMRIDAVMITQWSDLSSLQRQVPQGTIAGCLWTTERFFNDQMYIASRSRAWQAMVGRCQTLNPKP